MKKACGAWFVVYVILAVAVGMVVYRRFPVVQAAVGAGVVGGGVLWIGIGYFWGIKKKISDSGIVRRALSGVPPRDGEKMAAIGRIEPVSSALAAPLSKTACVAYKYEIYTGSGDDRTVHYDGFAMTPSMIQTQQGSVRLLAWPDLKNSPVDVPPEVGAKNAAEYIAATQFREPAVMNFRKSLTEMLDVYRDDDGTVRFDLIGMFEYQAGKNDTAKIDLETAHYREWLLRPGEQVCVIGTYSATRGGIVPSKTPLADPVTLEFGPPESFSGRQVTGAAGYLIGGTIFIAGALAALVALFTVIPLETTEKMAPQRVTSWDEIKLEQVIEKRIRTPLRQKGILPTDGFSVSLPEGRAQGRVRSGTADLTVSRVVVNDEDAGRTFDIDSGTVTLSTDAKGMPTRLTILRREVPLADASIIVTGRLGHVAYLSDDVACWVTFNAY